MDQLLANPAVQAGVAPFLAALLVATPLRGGRMLGLAITAGFLVVIALTMGFSFESLTSTRKLALVGFAAAIGALGIEVLALAPVRALRGGLAAAAAVSAVWVALRILQQRQTGTALLWGAAAAIYLALLTESALQVGNDGVRASATGLALGLGTGGLALLGASALMAQVGIAIGAAAGATLLVQILSGTRARPGWTLGLVPAFVCGLACLIAVVTGALPWYCLLPTLATPWATRLVPPGVRPVWLTSIFSAVVALIPMLLAVGLAWFTAGAST